MKTSVASSWHFISTYSVHVNSKYVFLILHSFLLEVSHRSKSNLIWIGSHYEYHTAQGYEIFCFHSRYRYHNSYSHRLFFHWVYFNIHRQKPFPTNTDTLWSKFSSHANYWYKDQFLKQKSKYPVYLQQTGRRQNFTGLTEFRFHMQLFISLNPKTIQSPSILPHVCRTMCAVRIRFFFWGATKRKR